MIVGAVKAIADMLANFFGWRTSASDNQSIAEVIDDKQDLEKACRYADEAVSYVHKHAFWDEVRHANHFDALVKRFRRYR